MGGLTEYAGVVRTEVVHHRSVVLFKGATAFAPLEVLDGVGAAGCGLQAGQFVDSGAFDFVARMPVHQAGGAFHQHEGFIFFHGAHDCMVEGVVCHGVKQGFFVVVEFRVAVPGDDIQFFCHFAVIQAVI